MAVVLGLHSEKRMGWVTPSDGAGGSYYEMPGLEPGSVVMQKGKMTYPQCTVGSGPYS